MAGENRESHGRLIELIEAVVDEFASREQVAQLESLLAANPEARQQFLRYVNLHSALHLRYSISPPVEVQAARPESRPSAPQERQRLSWGITAAFFVAPSLVIVLAALNLGDHSLALPGWAASVESVVQRSAGYVTSVLALSWVAVKHYSLVRHPWLCALGGGASVLLTSLTGFVAVDEFAEQELLRREAMIQAHVWITYDSVFYWPENLQQQTGRPAQEPTVDQIRLELSKLRGAGFTGLYVPECQQPEVAVIARQVGFTAIVQGIRVVDGKDLSNSETQRQIANAISASTFIDAFVLGELTAREVDFAELKGELARIRRKTGKPVTTSFVHDDYIGKRGDRLRELEDFTMRALARPWGDADGSDPRNAAQAVAAALETFRHDDKPSLLHTVFYPSGGGEGFTEDNQSKFFEEVRKLRIPLGVNIVYFTSFDMPWKGSLVDIDPAVLGYEVKPFEAHTGLFAVDFSGDEAEVEFRAKKAVRLFAEDKID